MSIAIINVGKPKTGKTTRAKKLLSLSKNEKIVYDINNEYSEIYNKPFLDFESFMDSIKNKKNSTILIEEATIFFNNRSTNKIIQDLLVRKRHTKNTIILNFHSFRTVPKEIFELCNYCIIGKTLDTIDTVKQKYNKESFLQAVNLVNENTDNFFTFTYDFYNM